MDGTIPVPSTFLLDNQTGRLATYNQCSPMCLNLQGHHPNKGRNKHLPHMLAKKNPLQGQRLEPTFLNWLQRFWASLAAKEKYAEDQQVNTGQASKAKTAFARQ